jgi:hypothetical protein
MNIQRLDRHYAPQTLALLDDLHVSLFGIQSRRLHAILVHDGLKHQIDCRIAVDSGDLLGVVLAAPASYWRSTPLKHWRLALECLRARLGASAPAPEGKHATPAPETVAAMRTGTPPRTWKTPADAWRIILVGTAARARGRGVAAQLYRDLMADRSLVARIAVDNTPSIRLHHSLGWSLYADGDVALAVHVRNHQAASGGITAVCRSTP